MSGQDNSIVKVKLHPFDHQVSGSTMMFKFDQYTIAKPLHDKEHNFYKSLPEDLKEFTAKYKGSVDIEFEERADGHIVFYCTLPEAKIQQLNLVDPRRIKEVQNVTILDFLEDDGFRLKRSGSVDMDENSLDAYDLPLKKLETNARLHKRLARHMGGVPSQRHRFILLENLVAGYTNPCILDLKMGTRTYGDDDSEDKKVNKRRKAESSTTKTLGVRLHGMQKYNCRTGKIETLDKYQGRELSDLRFREVIENFLSDGDRFRDELVQPILARLKRFQQCLSAQNTFRFYSSSLLIIYEGCVEADETCPRFDMRCIDFAHTTYNDCPISTAHVQRNGPDKGYLMGVQTLIEVFNSIPMKVG